VHKSNWAIIVGILVLFSHSGSIAIANESKPHSRANPGVKCIEVERARNTVRDPLNYPGAYEQGFQQGTAARTRGASFQPPTTAGEVARGYTDAYRLKPYAGQATTVPTTNEVKCGCRLRILQDVVFRSAIEPICKSTRAEIFSAKSDAYHPQAYDDGYREGIASKAKNETYQPRTAGGEFARGVEDGYFGRANTGQRYTELPIKDYKCKCNLIIRRDRDDEDEY
jgi:ribosome modulation factor